MALVAASKEPMHGWILQEYAHEACELASVFGLADYPINPGGPSSVDDEHDRQTNAAAERDDACHALLEYLDESLAIVSADESQEFANLRSDAPCRPGWPWVAHAQASRVGAGSPRIRSSSEAQASAASFAFAGSAGA